MSLHTIVRNICSSFHFGYTAAASQKTVSTQQGGDVVQYTEDILSQYKLTCRAYALMTPHHFTLNFQLHTHDPARHSFHLYDTIDVPFIQNFGNPISQSILSMVVQFVISTNLLAFLVFHLVSCARSYLSPLGCVCQLLVLPFTCHGSNIYSFISQHHTPTLPFPLDAHTSLLLNLCSAVSQVPLGPYWPAGQQCWSEAVVGQVTMQASPFSQGLGPVQVVANVNKLLSR